MGKERRIKNTALGQHLQQLGEMRREKAKKEMREAKEHEHALKQADTEAKRKLQEIELDTEQARKEARLLEHKAREKEDAQKKEAREKEQKAERFQKIIAAHVLGHLRAKVAARGASAKTALETACAMPAVRKRGSRTALAFHLPDFLCHEGGQGVPGTGVQARVFRRVGTQQDISGAKMMIFASESFEWTLCNEAVRMWRWGKCGPHEGPSPGLPSLQRRVWSSLACPGAPERAAGLPRPRISSWRVEVQPSAGLVVPRRLARLLAPSP